MDSSKSYPFYGFTYLEMAIVSVLLCAFFLTTLQSEEIQSDISMGAAPSATTVQSLSRIHDEIDALPLDPEIRQQMLLYIEVAESRIAVNDMNAAREAMLDFCRRIEWYRYQIGHDKISSMFNQSMQIAVELHNASID